MDDDEILAALAFAETTQMVLMERHHELLASGQTETAANLMV